MFSVVCCIYTLLQLSPYKVISRGNVLMYKSSSLVPMKQYPQIIARISASSLRLWNPLHKHTTTLVYINIKFGAAMISYKVKVTAKKLKENVPTFSHFVSAQLALLILYFLHSHRKFK